MKPFTRAAFLLNLSGTLAGGFISPGFANTILQGSGSTYVSFEADATGMFSNSTQTFWTSTNDVLSTGGSALYIGGTTLNDTAPHSFVQYQIKFATAGTYNLYYRWKADAARTVADQFTGNSCWIPNTFGSYTTPGAAAQVDFHLAQSNTGTQAPGDNVYHWQREADGTAYTVSQEDVDAGVPLILSVGTREAGFTVDRWVLSPEPALSESALDALANSENSVVFQGGSDAFVAFEADVKGTFSNSTQTFWTSTNDVLSTGGSALYIGGTTLNDTAPHSFVQYQIKFATAGTYNLYYRWKADAARTVADQFTGNSCWIPNTFGSYTTPGAAAQVDFHLAQSNTGTQAPGDNVYHWQREADGTAYTVSQEDVDAGVPLILSVGTREAGFTVDRWVLSPEPALSESALDALPNSGAASAALLIAKASGSAALNTVRVFFSRPLDPTSVSSDKFQMGGGIGVNNAVVDTGDPRQVLLTTTAQTQGTAYTVTVNGVKDTSGASIAPNTTGNFTAWKLLEGWATTELYLNVTGATVEDLKNSAGYQAGTPDEVRWVKGFQLNNDPRQPNMGARISALFNPESGGSYSFYPNNDNEAELFLSTDQTEAALQSLGVFPLSPAVFDDNIVATSPSLTSGQKYLLVGLVQSDGGDIYLNVAGKPGTSSTPAAGLPVLSGSRISTFVNPDLGKVTFKQLPVDASATEGSRARFQVKVEATESPVYYQWRVNGQDIPGATRTAYVTPVLQASDSGKSYSVVVSVAGRDTESSLAKVTVTAGEPSNLQPYVGINFVGGGDNLPGTLIPVDVAGVAPQENWNNLSGFQFDQVALFDAAGVATSITLSAQATEHWYCGTLASGEANGIMLQGFLSTGAATDPFPITLNNVPAGKYQLIVYSVGFPFQATYLESFALTGGGTYPTYHVKAETGLDFNATPGFRRMASTDANTRAGGNYIQYDDVSPAGDGSLVISTTWESTEVGNTHQPAVNAIQLIKVSAVTAKPSVTIASVQTTGFDLSWTDAAIGYVLESSAVLGPNSNWTAVVGAPNPIASQGSFQVNFSGSGAYYRLRKGN